METPRATVLLIEPSMVSRYGDEKRIGSLFLSPSLAHMYLAAPLIRDGFEVVFVDFNVDRICREDFLGLARRSAFILVSCWSCYMESVKLILDDVRGANGQAVIICGGPHCNLEKEPVEGADITVLGEAENLISPLLTALLENKPLAGFPGLIYREGGRTVRTPGMMKVENLDESEFPSLDILRGKSYKTVWGMDFVPIMSSRGCTFRCGYCSFGDLGYRERSVENVIGEIKNAVARGYRYIVFYDDNFLLNAKRAMRIMERIIEENIKIKIAVQGRADSSSEALYRVMRKAGVGLVLFGVESGNQDVLDFYNKGTTLEKIRTAVTLANRAGMATWAWLMIGAPMETREHFENTLRFVDDLKFDIIVVSLLRYEKGTRLWEDAVRRGLIGRDQNYVDANERLALFSEKELEEIVGSMARRFYRNPRRILRFIYKVLTVGDRAAIAGLIRSIPSLASMIIDMTRRSGEF